MKKYQQYNCGGGFIRKVDENKGAYMVNIGEGNQSVKNHPFAKHWYFF